MLRRGIALALFLAAGIAGAEEPALSLRVVGADSAESHTRRAVTFVLAIGNAGPGSRSLTLEPRLPQGWRALTQEGSFSVGPSESDLRIVTLLVPSGTPAGEYSLRYSVSDTGDPSVNADCNVKVIVLPEVSLDVRLLNSPAFAIAGNEYSASFVITNAGNVDARVDIEVTSGSSLPYTMRGLNEAAASVAAGGAKEFSVAVRTDAHMRESMHHALQVTVRLHPTADSPIGRGAPSEAVEARAASSVEVIPLSVDDSILTHTLLLDSETTAITGYQQTFSGGLQQELKTRGTLDGAGEHKIEADFVKQLDTSFNPIFNPMDRYSLQYESRFGELKLGDNGFTVSPLLAQDEFGRGVQGTLNLFPIRLSALYLQDAWSNQGARSLGGSVDVTVPRSGDWNDVVYRAGLSILSPLDDHIAVGLLQQFNPLENVQFLADAALQTDAAGTLSPALYTLSQGDLGPMSWTVRYDRAWPDFRGTYTDNQSMQAVAGVRLLGGSLTLHGGFSLSDSNLLLRTVLPSADRTMDITLGAAGEIPWSKTNLKCDWENLRTVDRLPAQSYSTRNNIIRVSLSQPFAFFRLTLDSTADFGLDEKNSVTSLQQAHALTLAYAQTPSSQYGISLRYNGWLDSGSKAQHLIGWDLSIRRIFGRTQIEAQASNSYFFQTDFPEIQAGIMGKITHAFPWGHTIAFRPDFWLSYEAGAWVPWYSLDITYGMPFNLPVSRKPNTAIIGGHVVNTTTGKPMPGVILRIDGLAAMTGAKGDFTFYLPHAGTKYLQVDMRTVGANLVSMKPMPLEVAAPGGSKTSLEIGMVEACTVTGNLGEYGFPDGTDAYVQADGTGRDSVEPRRVRLRGLGGAIVELSDGVTHLRKLTGPGGDFSFEEVRPGKYTARIVGGTMPNDATIEPATFELNLFPGEKKAVEFRVLQERRRIKILDSGSTVNIELPPAAGDGSASGGRRRSR